MVSFQSLVWLTICFLIIAVIAISHAAYEWLVNRYAPEDNWLPKPEIRTRRLPSDFEVLGENNEL